MFFRIVIITFLFCIYLLRIQAILVKNCGSSFTFENITVEGCTDDDSLCPATIGNEIEISFNINADSVDIDAVLQNNAFFVTRGTRFRLNVTPSDPCNAFECPLKINNWTPFSATISVSSSLQPLEGYLEWVMKHAVREDQFVCFQFPLQLTDELQ